MGGHLFEQKGYLVCYKLMGFCHKGSLNVVTSDHENALYNTRSASSFLETDRAAVALGPNMDGGHSSKRHCLPRPTIHLLVRSRLTLVLEVVAIVSVAEAH